MEGFISGHSLRVGSAVSLAQAGASVVDMQTAGRWADPKMPAHYARAELAETARGGSVLLREVGGQGASIDALARKRAHSSGNPKSKRTESLCKRFFLRLGVLVFGRSKHREFCANAIEIPLSGSGAEGFSASCGGCDPRSGYPCSITACPLATLHRIFSIFISHRKLLLCLST